MTNSRRSKSAEAHPAVAVQGLTKIFPVPFHPTRRVIAVNDLSLRIERGEFPPVPRRLDMCAWCRYAGVCRKEYPTEDATAAEETRDEAAESV